MAILGYKKSAAVRENELAQFLKARGLAGWLELATEGLESTAKCRIAHEIEAHCTEAIADHIAAGQSAQTAQSTALLELGNPLAAAENFQRTYLTVFEARSTWFMEWAASKPFLSFWVLLLDVAPVFAVVFFSVYFHQSFRLRLLALTILVVYLGWRLIPRLLCSRTLPRYALIKRLAFLRFLANIAFTICYSLFMYTIHHDIFSGVFLGLNLLLALNGGMRSPLRIWNKVRKMADTAELRNYGDTWI